MKSKKKIQEEVAEILEHQVDEDLGSSNRRDFLKRGCILGGGGLALGLLGGYGLRDAQGAPGAGASGTTISDEDIDAKRIAGVRIATEFITGTVPAGTDGDPYPIIAIQAAIDDIPGDRGIVFLPGGVWSGSGQILITKSRLVLDLGKAKLVFTGTDNAIVVTGPNNLIRNGHVDAQSLAAGNAAILLSDSQENVVRDVEINTNQVGLEISETGGSSSLYQKGENIKVIGTGVAGNVGLKISGTAANENRLIDCRVTGAETGFLIESGNRNKLRGLRVESCTTGIRDSGASETIVEGVYFEGNGTDLNVANSTRFKLTNPNIDMGASLVFPSTTHEPSIYEIGGGHFLSRRNVVIPATDTTYTHTFNTNVQYLTNTYLVVAIPRWDTTVYISSKGTTSVQFTFGTGAPGGGSFIDIIFIPMR